MTEKMPDWMQEEEGHKIPGGNDETGIEPSEVNGLKGPGDEQAKVKGDEIASLLGELDQLKEFVPSDSAVEDIVESAQFGPSLKITGSDRRRAQIFQGSILHQAKTAPGSTREKSTPQLPQRILFATVIICLVLVPQIFSKGLALVSPPDITAEVSSVYRLIQGLPTAAPILVVVDVEPALAGEMNMAAIPVINHLMDKKAIIEFVSSLPTGPAQAESLMGLSIGERNQPLAEAPRYSNLGFIPGGAAGMQNFIQSPQSIIQSPQVNRSLLKNDQFRQIDSLADYALLIVMSDRPEVARHWVEQAGPFLENTPFVAILSAQAGPALWPYISSVPSQIQGAVVGLAGGMAYERLINQALIPFSNWSSFNLGLIAAVFLMAGGGMINAFRRHGSTRTPQPPKPQKPESNTNGGTPV